MLCPLDDLNEVVSPTEMGRLADLARLDHYPIIRWMLTIQGQQIVGTQ